MYTQEQLGTGAHGEALRDEALRDEALRDEALRDEALRDALHARNEMEIHLRDRVGEVLDMYGMKFKDRSQKNMEEELQLLVLSRAAVCTGSSIVAACCSVLQCVAVCCSVLHCVAVCCSVLQRVAVYCSNDAAFLVSRCCLRWFLLFFAVFSSVLQCAAVCRSVLQCVAVCCSVLQCVAAMVQRVLSRAAV